MRFARGVNGRGIPAIHGSSPSPICSTTSLARRVVVETLDPALDERQHQVLGADVVVLQRVGFLLGVDHHLAGAVVEAGDEELAVPAAAPVAALQPRRHQGGPGTAGGPSTIWWTRWWESSSASAISRSEPPAAWSFLIACVVVDPRVRGLGLEVDERAATSPSPR